MKNLLIIILFFNFVYGINNSFSQNYESVEKYSKYLSGLSPYDYKNVSKAIDYYEKNFSNLSQEERDYGYFDFRKFYERVDSIFVIILHTGDPTYKPPNKIFRRAIDPNYENDKDVIEFKKSLSENGFFLSYGSEAGYYVGEVAGFMIKKFGNYVSPVISEYLKLRDVDLEKPAYYDVYIWISADEMANRLKDWDKYLNDYPNSPYFDAAKFEMHRYLNDFLGIYLPDVETNPDGESNLITFDMEGNMLESGKLLYQKLISECGNSYLGNLLREYYDVLEKNKFKRNSKVLEFLRSKGFEIYE